MEPRKLTTSLLTEDDLQELRLVFEAFDHDSDGLLDVEEVGALLQSFGKAMTEAEVRHQPIAGRSSLRGSPVSPPPNSHTS